MQYRDEFLESYYNHSCVIIPEKDVLDTDIAGFGCRVALKRWWNDLFLLSTTCERSRCFYSSYLAMTIDRFRQFRKYPHRIHPMSKFRTFWDCLILHIFILNKIIFRLTSTYFFDKLPRFLFYFGAMLELIIYADLYVNMKTGYIDNDNKRIILDTKDSMKHFCTTKLFFYFASAFPMHWFMFLKYGTEIDCGLCKSNQFICTLKIISVISLYRIYEMSAYWTYKRRSVVKTYYLKLLRIAVLGSVTMCQLYDLSDAITFLVFTYDGHIVPTSSLAFYSWLVYSGKSSIQQINTKIVIRDVTRMFRSVFLFQHKINRYYLDMLAVLIGHIITKSFFAWSLIECYYILHRIMYPMERLMRIKSSALNMVMSRQLSDEFRIKVEQYFDYKPTALKIVEKKNFLFRSLPDMLKKEMKMECHMKLMMRIPFFKEWPISVLQQIAIMLERDIYLKNDIVSEASVQSYGLMIVERGVLAVYSESYTEVGHLIDGDYFGELSLVTDKELSMSYVVAVTHSSVLILEKMTFRRIIMKDYPQLYYEMKAQLKARFTTENTS